MCHYCLGASLCCIWFFTMAVICRSPILLIGTTCLHCTYCYLDTLIVTMHLDVKKWLFPFEKFKNYSLLLYPNRLFYTAILIKYIQKTVSHISFWLLLCSEFIFKYYFMISLFWNKYSFLYKITIMKIWKRMKIWLIIIILYICLTILF